MASTNTAIFLSNVVMCAGLALGLSGCGSMHAQPNSKAPESPENIKKLGFGSILGGDGLVFSTAKITGRGDQPAVSCANAYLWKASLATLEFMPLISSDAVGGVIITDWYADAQKPREQIKVNVYIKSRDLISTGVQVQVYRRTLSAGSVWCNQPGDPVAARELERIILEKARQMRVQNEHLKA